MNTYQATPDPPVYDDDLDAIRKELVEIKEALRQQRPTPGGQGEESFWHAAVRDGKATQESVNLPLVTETEQEFWRNASRAGKTNEPYHPQHEYIHMGG